MNNKKNLGIYIHIPFCRTRCGYCDFNTYTGKEMLIEDYVRGIQREITFYSNHLSKDFIIHTIYFGGGTPSILPVDCFKDIVCYISENFLLTDYPEISTEANPRDLKRKYLDGIFASGVNRLSIGMQSAIPEELRILDRDQELTDVKYSVKNAKSIGFENISLDLIYGIPGQTLAAFKDSVDIALSLGPQHLSIYGLSLNSNTPLAKMIAAGEIPRIDGDLAGEMYAWMMDFLPKKGFRQYEISNWALEKEDKDFRCLHNLQYWKNQDYLGLGAGAHSFVEGKRWRNANQIKDYLRGINYNMKSEGFIHDATKDFSILDKSDIIKETMMMGLRLTYDGVNFSEFYDRFHIKMDDVYNDAIQRNCGLGLLELFEGPKGKSIRLTKKGRMLGNHVFEDFI